MKNGLDSQLYDPVSTMTIEGAPSFSDTVQASIGFQYDPILDAIRARSKYGFKPDLNFSAADHIPDDMKQFGSTLLYAVNQDHLNDMMLSITQNQERRDVLSRSSFMSQIGAGFLDPINLVSLPFGGPAVGTARSIARVGAGTAAIQTGAELLRAPVDPLSTTAESALNICAAAIFGGALGGLTSIPITRRANAIERAVDSTDEMTRALSGLSPEDVQAMGPRERRSFAAQSDEQLNIQRRDLLGAGAESQALKDIELERTLRRIEDLSQVRFNLICLLHLLFILTRGFTKG